MSSAQLTAATVVSPTTNTNAISNTTLNTSNILITHNDEKIPVTDNCHNINRSPALAENNNLDVIQDMIDLSANHLEGLRTQCATSVTLTQQEIRSLESKLVRYFSELLLTKERLNERIPASGLPHKTGNELKQWLRVVGLSQESLNACLNRLSSLEQLLEQSDEELKQMLCNNPSYREEEVRRLTKAMHNLRKCKELLNSNITGNDTREQLNEQWFWDSWDRHHHIHRGSIGNIGLSTASPRAHHRQHIRQPKTVLTMTVTATTAHATTATTTAATTTVTNAATSKSGCQSPVFSEQYSQAASTVAEANGSMQSSTLTLTLTPSPPNSPSTPSNTTTTPAATLIAVGVGVGGAAKNPPLRIKSAAATPPPIKKHQPILMNNTTIMHIIQEPTAAGTLVLNDKIDSNTQTFTPANSETTTVPRSRLPTDPSPDSYSSDISADILVEHNNNSSNVLHVPCSPGAGHVGMGHAISHRFTKVLKIMSTCNLCQKQMFIGLKCKDCKYRCHKDCEPHVPPSCGLPREYVDEFKQSFIKDQVVFSTLSTQSGGSPNLKKNTLTKPRQHGDSSSPSSSCTSSTPSSPALFHLQQQQQQHQQQQQQQQHNVGVNYMGGTTNSTMCSSAGGGSNSTTSSNLLSTPSALNKHQASQFNFPDVTITTTPNNFAAVVGIAANNTQTLLYVSQLQNTNNENNCEANEVDAMQQQINTNSNSNNNSSSNNVANEMLTHNNGGSNNIPYNSNSVVGTGSQISTHSSNISTFTSSLVSTGTGTFYPRKLSSAGVDKRIPFTSDMSDTHKSNDSDKTVSLSGSNSASTDSDRTPVRLDSTEDGDSGNWPRQNSVSLQEWDIPYGDLLFVEQIGKGRFGTVHRALWHGDVAVKVLNKGYVDDDHMLEAFKIEVANFKKTRHENLVLFMGACMNPPYLAIVTSLCKGYTLYTYIHVRREKFSINRTLIIAQQIAQGMGYLHARGIVHKDLRTKNIFIENGKVIITDFGLFSSTKLFYCDIGLGIPHNWLCYIAPELMRALMPRKPTDECLPFSRGSDIYSFGTVWYELLCGEFTFKGQPAESIIWQVGRGMKQTLANLQSGRDVKDLLMLCWTYAAPDRPDFKRLLRLLESLPKKRLARSPSHPVNLSRSAESVF